MHTCKFKPKEWMVLPPSCPLAQPAVHPERLRDLSPAQLAVAVHIDALCSSPASTKRVLGFWEKNTYYVVLCIQIQYYRRRI